MAAGWFPAGRRGEGSGVAARGEGRAAGRGEGEGSGAYPAARDGGNGTCDVTIDALSAWTVTGNSTVSSLICKGSITGADGKSVSIIGTDGTVFVQGEGEYTITTGSYEH